MSESKEQQEKIHFTLQEEVEFLRSSNRHYKLVIDALRATVDKLNEKVDFLNYQLYGTKNERATQIIIPIEIEESSEEELPQTPQKEQQTPSQNKKESTQREKKPHKRKLMVRTDNIVEHLIIPEEVKQNPSAYRQLPSSMDKVSVRLEQIPCCLEVHYYRRPCYEPLEADGSCEPKIFCAPAPVSILSGSNMGAGLLAHVLHSKFCLHMPFYRMIQELERMGLSGLDEATVCNWHKAVADALRPIWEAMHGELMDSAVLHVDETPFRCLRSDKKKGYMWALSCAESGMNLYYWQNGRSGDALDTLLRSGMNEEGIPYGGTIVSDGYDAYGSWIKKLEKSGQAVGWQNCWAHVRRKFVETARCGNDPKWSRLMVEMISPLYEIERHLREIDAPPEIVANNRLTKSKPLAEAFFTELERKLKDTENPPLNKLKGAIEYALNRKDALMTWLYDSSVPMDNNQVERAIRPLTIGRRNSLFIGAPEAGERSAILYTMVEECKRVGVNPREWLETVLRILPTYRTAGKYLDLLPGILPLPSQKAIAPVQL